MKTMGLKQAEPKKKKMPKQQNDPFVNIICLCS